MRMKDADQAFIDQMPGSRSQELQEMIRQLEIGLSEAYGVWCQLEIETVRICETVYVGNSNVAQFSDCFIEYLPGIRYDQVDKFNQ